MREGESRWSGRWSRCHNENFGSPTQTEALVVWRSAEAFRASNRSAWNVPAVGGVHRFVKPRWGLSLPIATNQSNLAMGLEQRTDLRVPKLVLT